MGLNAYGAMLTTLAGVDACPLAKQLNSADVVEVSPAYDHAEMTTVAAAHACYELPALLALAGSGATAA